MLLSPSSQAIYEMSRGEQDLIEDLKLARKVSVFFLQSLIALQIIKFTYPCKHYTSAASGPESTFWKLSWKVEASSRATSAALVATNPALKQSGFAVLHSCLGNSSPRWEQFRQESPSPFLGLDALIQSQNDVVTSPKSMLLFRLHFKSVLDLIHPPGLCLYRQLLAGGDLNAF